MTGARATWALLGLLAGAPGIAAPPTGALDGNYDYHTRAGDTLIGLGRRLLVDPSRWHDLQVMNRVAQPRQMPRDTVLAIPYRWLRLTPDTAEVVALAGEARAAGQPLKVGEKLAEGSVVETGAGGSVTLAMADGSVVSVQKSSRLELDRLERIDGLGAHDVSFRLTAGRVETKVQPQRDVGRFEIHTPVAVTAVRGTRFRATYDTSDSDARTETLEGVVGVSANAALVPVAQGYGTRVEHGAAPGAPVLLPPAPTLEAVPAVNAAPDLDIRYLPVAGAARYRAQLSGDEQFYTLVRDELTSEAAVHLADLADGAYYLRVRSVDPAGLEGADVVHRFIQRRAPPPPVPQAPAEAANIPGRSTDFAWSEAPGGVHYAFELARDAAFAAPVHAEPALAEPRLTLGTLDPGTYYWRVAAINGDGARGPWSEPRAYHQRALAPQPEAVVAHDHARVSWAAMGAGAYQVEIAHDARFRHPVAQATVPGQAWESPLLQGGDYYVRVRPIDGDGYTGAPGAASRFHVPYPAWLKFAPLVLVVPFL